MATPAPKKARRLGAFAAAMLMSTALVGALAPAAFAQDSETPAADGNRRQLTDEQKACLEEQGVQKPAAGADGERVKPTDEQKAAFKAAAEACNIDLPLRRHRGPALTDEQKACLQEQGIEKPAAGADGERVKPTDEQKAAFKAAAEACNIELPARGPHGRPELTDEQKACLQEQGIEKPAAGADGERVKPTDEQRAAFRAAAETCGIDLPDAPPSDSDAS